MRAPLLIVVSAWALASCGSAPRPPEAAALLLEDFEQDTLWSLDSANDYAALSFTGHSATSGRWALQVDYCDNGREKAILRKEVDLDLSGVRALLVDVDNVGAKSPSFALALRGRDGALYETSPVVLHPGMNRDLTFTLDASGFKTGTDPALWATGSKEVNRLLAYILPDKSDGRVIIDQLRYLGGPVLRRDQARFIDVARPAGDVARHATAEIHASVAFPADRLMTKDARADSFMRRMTAVSARVRAPDGTELTLPGFCEDIAPGESDAVYRYGLRLSPHLAGEWRFQLGVTAAGAVTWSEPLSFICVETSAHRGPIQVDAGDPRWFSRADGSWFYPLGENVAWSGDYEPYLKPLAAAGGTLIRTWICPWNDGLDVGGKLEVVNFASAAHLDHLFELAETNGVAVQLCLQYHGMLRGDWARNPFNQVNGGPCTDAREFWSNGRARVLFKRYLDYVVARWGYSPQLFAWELWNEADLTPRFTDADVVSWHREMSDYLKAIDPHHHLVTTSTTSPSAFPEIWRLAGIDVAEIHGYDPHPGPSLSRLALAMADVRRPLIIAEVGRGWDAPDDQGDHQGAYLRHALWISWMCGFSGSSMPWWWDTHIEPNGLHAQFRPLAAFVAGEDPRGHQLRAVEVPVAPGWDAHCLIAADLAYGFVGDAGALARPGAAPLAKDGPRGTLTVSGLSPGDWTLEIWDVDAGVVASRREVRVEQGSLAIPTGDAPAEFAFKLKRLHPTAASVRFEPAKR